MNTKGIGEISEAMITAALLRAGYSLLRPVGDNMRYDLLIDCRDGTFKRVQCKTGKLHNGRIYAHTCSSYAHRGLGRKHYRGCADLFGIYCRELDQSFLIPVDQVGISGLSLRVSAPANNQAAKVRWAKDYLIKGR